MQNSNKADHETTQDVLVASFKLASITVRLAGYFVVQSG